MIDTDAVYQCFIDRAREALPTQLSMIGPQADIPAVIKSRQVGAKPEYPYVTVDMITISETHGDTTAEYLNAQNLPVIETHYKILMQYTVYGGDAMNIGQRLRGYFRLPQALAAITADTTGTLEDTFDVISRPEALSTEFLEVAALQLTMNISDCISDTQSGVFDTINLNGEMKYRDDPDPSNAVDITISETSNALP